MNLTCESCGGKNSLAKGKTEMYCSFCGNHIVVVAKPIAKVKTKTVNSGSDKEKILEYVRSGSKGKLDLPYANLKGISLKGANLEGANLNNGNFKGADFSGANLKKVNFSHSNLKEVNLSKADLNGADLSNIETYGDENSTEFCSSNLSNANLKNADLSNCDFTDADLTLAIFDGADLYWAKLINTSISLSQLKSIKNLRNAEIANVSLKGANFSGVAFSYAQFKNCDFSNADFSNASLISCKFTNTKLTNANLSGTNLEHADLQGSDLHNANLSNSSLRFSYLYRTNFNGANLSGADLSEAHLSDETNFNGANLKGAKGIKTKGCYLTTACIEAMQLPDDCYELQTLRKFRDDFVAQMPDGRKMIEEYYETAPEIVIAINAKGNGNEIFKGLFSEINDIVLLIEDGKSAEAVLAYRNLTLSHKNKYLN